LYVQFSIDLLPKRRLKRIFGGQATNKGGASINGVAVHPDEPDKGRRNSGRTLVRLDYELGFTAARIEANDNS